MIKIEVTGGSISELSDKLLALGASLQSARTSEVEDTPAPEPKAEEPKAPKPKAEEPKAEEPKAEEPAGLDFDTEVAPIVLSTVKSKGKPVVQEILSQFGVERASQLDEDRWPELLAALGDA